MDACTIQQRACKVKHVLATLLMLAFLAATYNQAMPRHMHDLPRRLSDSAITRLNESGGYSVSSEHLPANIYTTMVKVQELCLHNDATSTMTWTLMSMDTKKSYSSGVYPPGQTRCLHGSLVKAAQDELLHCEYTFGSSTLRCPGRGFRYSSTSWYQQYFRCFGDTEPACEVSGLQMIP